MHNGVKNSGAIKLLNATIVTSTYFYNRNWNQYEAKIVEKRCVLSQSFADALSRKQKQILNLTMTVKLISFIYFLQNLFFVLYLEKALRTLQMIEIVFVEVVESEYLGTIQQTFAKNNGVLLSRS